MDWLHFTIYYGNTWVGFESVDGCFTPSLNSEKDEFQISTDEESYLRISKQRLCGSTQLGEGYEDLIIPAIPAFDIEYHPKPNTSNATIPQELQHPLLKAVSLDPYNITDNHNGNQDSNYHVIGVHSGRRSAIIPHPPPMNLNNNHDSEKNYTSNGDNKDQKYYRLKGCGDLLNGFPIRRVEDIKEELYEIRGCMFEHTCLRELYMTKWINQILIQNKLKPANLPVGYWEYSSSIPRSTKPKINKYCAIYQSYGDRRLSDHLLVGLERLLPLVIDSQQINLPQLMSQFPESRKTEEGTISETWMAALLSQDLTDLKRNLGRFYDYQYFHETFDIREEENSSHSSTYHSLWQQSVKSLKESQLPLRTDKQQFPGSLLAYIYYRVGWEAGTIQRLLNVENGISWGTYEDSLGFHCNAHPNNLVILPPGNDPSSPFLAPLDFDMAFPQSAFRRVTKQGEASTNQDFFFREWMEMEKKAMMMSLAGDDKLNTGVKGNTQLDSKLTVVKLALRDTMMLGFLHGFDKDEEHYPSIPELYQTVYHLITMALILTVQEIV